MNGTNALTYLNRSFVILAYHYHDDYDDDDDLVGRMESWNDSQKNDDLEGYPTVLDLEHDDDLVEEHCKQQ